MTKEEGKNLRVVCVYTYVLLLYDEERGKNSSFSALCSQLQRSDASFQRSLSVTVRERKREGQVVYLKRMCIRTSEIRLSPTSRRNRFLFSSTTSKLCSSSSSHVSLLPISIHEFYLFFLPMVAGVRRFLPFALRLLIVSMPLPVLALTRKPEVRARDFFVPPSFYMRTTTAHNDGQIVASIHSTKQQYQGQQNDRKQSVSCTTGGICMVFRYSIGFLSFFGTRPSYTQTLCLSVDVSLHPLFLLSSTMSHVPCMLFPSFCCTE